MTNFYFFDTDCLSSFLMTDNEEIILDMYSGIIVLPSFVYSETMKKEGLREKVLDLEKRKLIIKHDIIHGTDEYREYIHLTSKNYSDKVIGKGEASAIACVKCQGGILASNNFKDISYYIDKYQLDYITTSDILLDAFNEKRLSLQQANNIWKQMREIGNYMPNKTFSEYLKKQTKEIEKG